MSGVATISIELELGTGLVHFDKLDVLSPGRKRETATLSRLLDLCDSLDLPVTFDVVGHLFLDSPYHTYEGPHEKGWFDAIPKTGRDTDPEFYAPDLIQAIQDASVEHEIGTHTFSHVECRKVSPEVVSWELERASDVHRDHGLPSPVALVPPRHSTPPHDLLRDTDIEIIRVPHYQTDGYRRPTSNVLWTLDILRGVHPVREPQLVGGIVRTYSTQHLSLASLLFPAGQAPPHPVFRQLPKRLRRWIHSRNLDRPLERAISSRSYVHYWSHLFDFANDIQFEQVERFLRYLAGRRDEGDIVILSMGDVNRRVREN